MRIIVSLKAGAYRGVYGRLGVFFAVYCCAALVSIVLAGLLPFRHPLLFLAASHVVAVTIVFLCALLLRRPFLARSYRLFAPLFTAFEFFLLFEPGGKVPACRSAVVSGMILIWAARLVFLWYRLENAGDEEALITTEIRKRSGKLSYVAGLGLLFVLPGLLVVFGSLTLYPVLAYSSPMNIFDIAGFLFMLSAMVIQTEAALQMYSFRKPGESSPGERPERGIWRFSRHPDHFGQVLFWWGIYLFSLAANPVYWWLIVFPGLISVGVVVLLIPAFERHLLKQCPSYAEYRRSTSAFFLWFPGYEREYVYEDSGVHH